MMYLLDFDRTLFDTDAFNATLAGHPACADFAGEIRAAIAEGGADRAAVWAKVVEAARAGSLSFAPGELAPFVYPDVAEFLRFAGNEAVLLTFGDPLLQARKVASALHGIPRVSALYTGSVRKGAFMQERIAAYGRAPVFVDDRAIELEDMAHHCPQVRLYEMRRDGLPGDGRWPVVRSLSELPHI